MVPFDLEKYKKLLDKEYVEEIGRVVKIVGLTIEATGPKSNLNDVCKIFSADQSQTKLAEVVGFRENRIILMPYDNMTGVGIGSYVQNVERLFRFQ